MSSGTDSCLKCGSERCVCCRTCWQRVCICDKVIPRPKRDTAITLNANSTIDDVVKFCESASGPTDVAEVAFWIADHAEMFNWTDNDEIDGMPVSYDRSCAMIEVSGQAIPLLHGRQERCVTSAITMSRVRRALKLLDAVSYKGVYLESSK